MNVLSVLIPVSVFLGLLGLVAFVWSLRAGQYDDPKGVRARILDERWDTAPRPDGGIGGTSGAET